MLNNGYTKFKTPPDTHDSDEYFDMSKAQRVSFPNLKPTTKTISLRLPDSLLETIKMLANKLDVPYQSLIKIFLAEKVNEKIKNNL